MGPNVTIGRGVRIGAGVRIRESVILDNVEIQDRSCVLYSIIGWNSTIGKWTRIEGSADGGSFAGIAVDGITILGTGVQAASQITVRNSIVLPDKLLCDNLSNEILL